MTMRDHVAAGRAAHALLVGRYTVAAAAAAAAVVLSATAIGWAAHRDALGESPPGPVSSPMVRVEQTSAAASIRFSGSTQELTTSL